MIVQINERLKTRSEVKNLPAGYTEQEWCDKLNGMAKPNIDGEASVLPASHIKYEIL